MGPRFRGDGKKMISGADYNGQPHCHPHTFNENQTAIERRHPLPHAMV
jgi:hypothetical protein